MAINYTVSNDWGSGFTGSMTVPGGSQGLQGWTLEFDAGFDITNIWNAEIVSHVGNHYVIRSASWNANVAAGGQASFGFQATEGATGSTATGFILNGATSAPPPPPVVPTLSIADASIKESGIGTGELSFTVTLSQAATSAVTVHYGTADGTAKAGTDYNALSGTLTFAPGQTTQTITVPILADSAAAPSETFTLALTSPTGATLARGAATGTILHDSPPPTGVPSLAYTVTSNWGSGFNGAMTVTAGSSALTSWTVEFDSTANITNIWNATIVSHVGNHYVVSNAAYNGQVGAGQSASFGFQATAGSSGTAASGFVINGVPAGGGSPPPAPTLPTLSIADASVMQSNSATTELAFTVSLSAASMTPVTVAYATSDGTATAGSDYTAATGTLTFAAGQTSQVVNIAVASDATYDANETLTLALASPSGATIAHGTATGTILNDNPPPAVSISNASFAEGSAASPGHGSFTVSLSAASGLPVTVHYGTQDGTAVAGKDYVALSGTLTFAPGQTQQTIQVAGTGNTLAASESFNVVLSSPSGATIAQGTGTGTIQAAPPAPPTISIDNTTAVEGGSSSGGLSGPLSTLGNQIVNSAGQPVEIAGVNWFGLESTNMSPDGLWARNYKDMMNQMVQLGFNTIRLPFSSEMLHSTAVASGINYSLNPDLQGLAGLQVMDKIVQYADQIGIKIILDHHRSEAGDGTSANGLWYDSQYTQAQWVSDWQMLAQRYAKDPSVIGADLHNEPYN